MDLKSEVSFPVFRYHQQKATHQQAPSFIKQGRVMLLDSLEVCFNLISPLVKKFTILVLDYLPRIVFGAAGLAELKPVSLIQLL